MPDSVGHLGNAVGGQVIAELRRAQDLSQEELAERTGVSARSIGSLERGLIGRPRRATLLSLAEAFGLDDASRDEFVARVRKSSGPPVEKPAQLPPGDSRFVGRRAELARLDELLLGSDGAVVVIEGHAGLGKTQLALHWAHRAKGHFGDGQLFARLHGFGASAPTEPSEVLAEFLTALGVPRTKMPVSLDGRTGLLRSLLVGKKALLIIDDAADFDQVASLLPGDETCATLITTRRRMVGLAARHGCQRLTLDPMSHSEATGVLTTQARSHLDADQLDRAVAACAGLPLALRVLGCQAEDLGWDYVLDQLDTGSKLDGISVATDSAADVRKILGTSVERLGEDASVVLGMMGLCSTSEIARLALTALTGWNPARTTTAIAELIADHLLEPLGDRLMVHDLIAEYAREVAATWSKQRQDAALTALTRLVIDIAEAGKSAGPGDPLAGVRPARLSPESIPLPTDPMSWLEAEQSTVSRVIDWVSFSDRTDLTTKLADALWVHMRRVMREIDAPKLYEAAADAARRSTNQAGLSRPLRYLGIMRIRAGNWRSGRQLMEEAVTLAHEHGDLLDEAEATFLLAEAHHRLGDQGRAIDATLRARELHLRAGVPLPEATVLQNIGIFHFHLGHLAEAENWLSRALAIAPDAPSDDVHRGMGLCYLGLVEQRRGRTDTGQDLLEQAVAVLRDTGYDELQAFAEVRYAEVCVSAGDLTLAAELLADVRQRWTSATLTLEILDLLQNTEAEWAVAAGDTDRAIRLFETVVQRAEAGHDHEECERARSGLIMIQTLSDRLGPGESA